MAKFQPIGLITTDLHLTDKGGDEYRFQLFEWIKENYGDKLSYLFILGDLTDKKNYHADHLVDKIANTIHDLTRYFQVMILRGNHDYDANVDTPFFGFLGNMSGVTYFRQPTLWRCNWSALFLPHSREPGKDWKLNQYRDLDAIFLHQTFNGAVSETGYELEGIGTTPFRKFGCPIFSGDVHVPQQVGPVTYVGSPYHIHFGDQFTPRLLLFDEKFRTVETYFPSPRKIVFDIRRSSDLLKHMEDIRVGDKAKIRLHLPTGKLDNWVVEQGKIRQIAKDAGLILESLVLKETSSNTKEISIGTAQKRRSRREIFNDYCKRNLLAENIVSAGEELLED